jgi:hypothetical protein
MENTTSSAEKASPKHVFLHLFVIILLYYSTVNFLVLLFQCINRWIPDILAKTDYYQLMFNSGAIRFALASLIIVFPVFMITSKYLRKSYITSPAIREMRIRKWLTYFTLFIAALVMVGDLVRTILVFLEGEITMRFVLKALAVLLVAGAIFFYYLRDLKHEKMVVSTKIFVWGAIVVVLAAVVAGFFVIGSPKTERARRFDYERVANLQEAQSQIIFYWQSKERLPVALGNLSDSISGYITPTDPETGAAYEYIVIGTTTFKLCATFNLASETDPNIAAETKYAMYPGGVMENWSHGAGQACFERTIDPELYKSFEKIK